MQYNPQGNPTAQSLVSPSSTNDEVTLFYFAGLRGNAWSAHDLCESKTAIALKVPSIAWQAEVLVVQLQDGLRWKRWNNF